MEDINCSHLRSKIKDMEQENYELKQKIKELHTKNGMLINEIIRLRGEQKWKEKTKGYGKKK